MLHPSYIYIQTYFMHYTGDKQILAAWDQTVHFSVFVNFSGCWVWRIKEDWIRVVIQTETSTTCCSTGLSVFWKKIYCTLKEG